MKFKNLVIPFLLIYPCISFPQQHYEEHPKSANIEQNVRDTIDLTGSWIWEGRPMNDRDVIRNGKMEITLHQLGTNLTGTLVQNNGPYGDIPEKGNVEGWNAHLTGIIVPASSSESSMIQLRRINTDNAFEAIFTGNISDNGNHIDGFFVNNGGPGGGWFVMTRKENKEWGSTYSEGRKRNFSEAETARQAIQYMMDDFERGIAGKDRTLLSSLFDQPGTPIVGIEDNEIHRQTAEQFIEYIVHAEQNIEEKLKNAVINVRNHIAVMTCDYEYFVNGEKLGCGAEVWTLIKTDKGWQIASFLWGL